MFDIPYEMQLYKPIIEILEHHPEIVKYIPLTSEEEKRFIELYGEKKLHLMDCLA
jgi:hypothetical protein